MIGADNLVTLTYELRLEPEGEIFQKVTEDEPFSFISGRKQLLSLFEANVLMKKEGDEFSFKIAPESGYGVRSEEMVVDIEREVFSSLEEGALVVGKEIGMVDSMGRQLIGRVAEIHDDHVKMDFNHPLAGRTLYFSGKILGVRPATEEELAALESSSCGCDCEGCGGDCGHEHHNDECDCGHEHHHGKGSAHGDCFGEGPSGCCDN